MFLIKTRKTGLKRKTEVFKSIEKMGYTTLKIWIKGYATNMWPQINRIISRFFL